MANDIKSARAAMKAKPIKAMLKQTEDEDKAAGWSGNNEYLNLEDGKTLKIRIFPAHPGHEDFYVARKQYWLTFYGDDGAKRRGTVPDAVFHGGNERDVVQEYIKAAKAKWEGKKGGDKKIAALTATGQKSESLNPKFSWMAYAGLVPAADDEEQEIRAKVWEFKKMVRDGLNKLAFQEDADEPIEVDPFTDPDEGMPILAKYLKKPGKGEDYYTISFPRNPKARPLTDEELEYFLGLKPLSELIGNYTKRDHDRAVEGLQNFDEENEIGLFDDDEWLDTVAEIAGQYEASDDDDEEERPAKKKTVAKPTSKKPVKDEEPDEEPDEPEEEPDEADEEPEADAEPDGDEYDEMERPELKKVLKELDPDFVVYKKTEDDELRAAIRERLAAADEEPEADDEPEEEPDEEPEPPKKKPAAAPKAGSTGLDGIRAKLGTKPKK